jgi:hypothetical protein
MSLSFFDFSKNESVNSGRVEKSKNESDIDKSAESDVYLPCDNSSTSGVNTQETHGHEDRVEDVFDELKNLRRKHPLQFMCAYLNINSLRYKFCLIGELLTSNIVNMLFLAETKIDETFRHSVQSKRFPLLACGQKPVWW